MTDNLPTDVTTQILIQIRDEIRDMRASFEARMDALEARMDRLEGRMDALEKTNEVQHRELFSRLSQIDADLKKFAPLVNEALLHYADEMDRVRARLTRVEHRLGITPGSK
jgi:methyl-accepting chemotaxis protein